MDKKDLGQTMFKVMFFVFGCLIFGALLSTTAIFVMGGFRADVHLPYDVFLITVAVTFIFGTLNTAGFVLLYNKLKLISKRLDQMENDRVEMGDDEP